MSEFYVGFDRREPDQAPPTKEQIKAVTLWLWSLDPTGVKPELEELKEVVVDLIAVIES